MKQPWIRITNSLLVAVCLVLGWIIYQQRESFAETQTAKVALVPRHSASPQPKPAVPVTTPHVTFKLGAAAAPLPTPAHYPSEREIVREHPEYAGVLRRRKERFLLARYETAIEALKLSPEVTARLCDLLFEKELSAADAKQVAKADGLPPHSAAFGQAVQQAGDAVDAEIAKLVGTDGLRELHAAQQLDRYQHMVRGNLAPALEMAGKRLSAQQAADLAQAWYATNDPTVNPTATQPGFHAPDPSTDLSKGDEALLNRAAQILPPDDLATLRRYLKDQNIQKLVRALHPPSF